MFVDEVVIVIVEFWMVGGRRSVEEEGSEGRGDVKGPARESRAENVIVVVKSSERLGCMMPPTAIAVFRATQR